MDFEEEYLTGHVILDKQNEELIRLINRLDSSSGNEEELIKEVYGEMLGYSLTHFECEEKLLIAASITNVGNHIKEHAKFHNYVRNIYPPKAIQSPPSTKEISLFLRNWFNEHIRNQDAIIRTLL